MGRLRVHSRWLILLAVLLVSLAVLAAEASAIVDTTPPVTTATGPSGWINHTGTVKFVATDLGGSGVAATFFQVDGGAWQTGTQVSIVAHLGTHSTDGWHTVAYYSKDNAGNTEIAKTLSFGIDTRRPEAEAFKWLPPYCHHGVKIHVGGRAILGYAVLDKAPNGGTADVTIKIYRVHGNKLVLTLKYNDQPVNVPLFTNFIWTMKKGDYVYHVYAIDTAGNTQSESDSLRFTVVK